jgi:peroxiredoxin
MIAAAKSGFPERCDARAVLRLGLLMMAACGPVAVASADSLLGQKAPEWTGAVWVNSPALRLPELAGKVVLVRWWTAPSCPYCRATAPALNEFFQQYRDRGLEVIGFYHHKSSEPLQLDAVRQQARRFGFEFPVAVDPKWQTLKAWWLDRGEERWTSVSFLLDRRGIVRHIHPGGQYVKGDKDYRLLKSKIEELLAEPEL